MNDFIDSNQQPIARVFGRRRAPPFGEPPSPQARAAQAHMTRHSLCAPKGVFIDDGPEQMDADRLRWTVERTVAVALGEER